MSFAKRIMPRNIAQWTGIAVAAVVTLGCDIDVAWAVPLGVFAGALATFFVAVAESRLVAGRVADKR